MEQSIKLQKIINIKKIYLDMSVIDEIITVSDDDAIKYVKTLGYKEGLLVGISSGANVYAALELSKKYKYKKIVTVAPDGIEKYLSMNIF